MKTLAKKSLFIIPIVLVLLFSALCVFVAPASFTYAATKTTMTRQGDSVWFGIIRRPKRPRTNSRK